MWEERKFPICIVSAFFFLGKVYRMVYRNGHHSVMNPEMIKSNHLLCSRIAITKTAIIFLIVSVSIVIYSLKSSVTSSNSFQGFGLPLFYHFLSIFKTNWVFTYHILYKSFLLLVKKQWYPPWSWNALGSFCSHYFLFLKCPSSSPFSLYQNLTYLLRLRSKLTFPPKLGPHQLTVLLSFSEGLRHFCYSLGTWQSMSIVILVYTSFLPSKQLVPNKCFLIILLMLPIIHQKLPQMFKNKIYFISLRNIECLL